MGKSTRPRMSFSDIAGGAPEEEDDINETTNNSKGDSDMSSEEGNKTGSEKFAESVNNAAKMVITYRDTATDHSQGQGSEFLSDGDNVRPTKATSDEFYEAASVAIIRALEHIVKTRDKSERNRFAITEWESLLAAIATEALSEEERYRVFMTKPVKKKLGDMINRFMSEEFNGKLTEIVNAMYKGEEEENLPTFLVTQMKAVDLATPKNESTTIIISEATIAKKPVEYKQPSKSLFAGTPLEDNPIFMSIERVAITPLRNAIGLIN